jgi:hypothetical protein
MTPIVGALWHVSGMWPGEASAWVRIMEVLPSGSVDVNYELDPTQPADLRILPAQCLLAPQPR